MADSPAEQASVACIFRQLNFRPAIFLPARGIGAPCHHYLDLITVITIYIRGLGGRFGWPGLHISMASAPRMTRNCHGLSAQNLTMIKCRILFLSVNGVFLCCKKSDHFIVI